MRFERRNIVVRTMEVADVEDYYYQFSMLSQAERNEKIRKVQKEIARMENDINSTVTLVAVEKDTNKLIGTIYGKRNGSTEEISVSIPNESKMLRYGFEVVDQFLKICKEQWTDIKVVKLNRNKATEIYLKERNLATEYVVVAS